MYITYKYIANVACFFGGGLKYLKGKQSRGGVLLVHCQNVGQPERAHANATAIQVSHMDGSGP